YPYAERSSKDKAEFLSSESYLSTQTMLFFDKNTKLDDLNGYTLADVKGRVGYTYNPKIPVINYNSQIDCLNAVRSGQADTAVCDVFTGSFLAQRYTTRDLVQIPTTEAMELSFALSPAMGMEAASALTKAIRSMPRSKINECLTKGNQNHRFEPLEFVYKYPFEIICFFTSMLFVFVLILFTYSKIRSRQQQTLRGYEENYRLLSDIFGEAGMEYDCLNDRLTVFGRHSKLDIGENVEDFKEQLRNNSLRISLTPQQFETIVEEGAENKSFTAEFQCGVKDGGWIWYQLIYTVLCTEESHRRPIRLVGCLANIDAQHNEKEALRELSSMDQLTKVYNHATGEKMIRHRLESGINPDEIMIIADIDYFKNFNDEMGHLCGDDVLRTLGGYLGEAFPNDGIVCRWGGDEFLLFVNVEDKARFNKTMAELRKKMQRYKYNGESHPVTMSMGGAECSSDSSFDLLFKQADDALYEAKKVGRNRLCIYKPQQSEKTPEKIL
ncbi:MAG: GGDEF domain-containing protein, partial [Oscillospiraceae bacterium]